MDYRLFGNTGLRVSELFLGAMTFGEEAGGVAFDTAREIVDAYAEAGGNVIDTANIYLGGHSEEYVGRLLEGRRDRFVLATKYTLSRDRSDPNAAGNHRKNLVASLEDSLRRLRTDYVDVYWAHIWDPFTPIEETMRALDDVVRAGKVLYVGFSDAPAWLVARANTLAEWRGWTPFAGIQVPYSLIRRDAERELIPMAEALGLSVAAWAPLAAGILSGKYRTPGAKGRHDAAKLPERSHTIADAVVEVAGELGVSPAQVALAWIRARSERVFPLVGASGAAQIKDSLASLDLVLPDEASARLEAVTGFEVGFPRDFMAEHKTHGAL
ncbi:aldo/keto reductase [Phytomonospora sp. NPDC050363]|uniref:aldo/keto reductase n=1 Tax=Phytomonospora sp. NPDC050363 TaxID=3155642 RepID=UPI0033D2E1F4